ncbi:MAG: hypothetical protein WA047_11020 [Phenylobacterium sp.]|uniref:hypothetical protein n=1 Tax=Phenylobacterium sp. TaxID=1871053 RepID=UPI003BB4DD72
MRGNYRSDDPMRERSELRAVRMMVVRRAVRGCVLGRADLLLGVIALVIVVIEMNLPAER